MPPLIGPVPEVCPHCGYSPYSWEIAKQTIGGQVMDAPAGTKMRGMNEIRSLNIRYGWCGVCGKDPRRSPEAWVAYLREYDSK